MKKIFDEIKRYEKNTGADFDDVLTTFRIDFDELVEGMMDGESLETMIERLARIS